MSSWKTKERVRSLVAREEGIITKPWGSLTSVALVYPNTYRVGMANLGFQTVYFLCNADKNVLCERAFLPSDKVQKELQKSRQPLFSYESLTDLSRFDILAFSVAFEHDYINVLKILDLSRVPLKRENRRASHPLIVSGGFAVSLNPEPLSAFIDCFVIGEAEGGILDQLITVYREGRDGSKTALLRRLSKLNGVYIPRTVDEGVRPGKRGNTKGEYRVQRARAKSLDDVPVYSRFFSPEMEFADMFLLEINRGCGQGCRFCAGGFFCRPLRHRSLSCMERVLKEGIEKKKTIGLIGSSLTEHPEFDFLCRLILKSGGKISFSSLRIDGLSGKRIEILRESGQKTVTLAPEAGSEPLRRKIGKNISNEQFFECLANVFDSGIPHLRLYFLLGLPGETWDDIDSLIRMVKEANTILIGKRKSFGKPGSLTVIISPFVPKAHTPFQWHPFARVEVLEEKYRRIRKDLAREPNLSIKGESPFQSYIQALLSRGDRQVGDLLLTCMKNGGNWKKTLKESDIDTDGYVYRQFEFSDPLPWDFIETGLSKKTLQDQYHRGLTS